MNIDLDELERLAKAADHGGRWFLDETDGDFWVYRFATEDEAGTEGHVVNIGGSRFQAVGVAFDPEDLNVGRFIAAANPAAILALTARVRELEAALRHVAAYAEVNPHRTDEDEVWVTLADLRAAARVLGEPA